jgi:hypothetical protein
VKLWIACRLNELGMSVCLLALRLGTWDAASDVADDGIVICGKSLDAIDLHRDHLAPRQTREGGR